MVVKRKPVLATKAWTEPRAATATPQLVMGLDPGFATLGVVILEKLTPQIQPNVVLATTLETQKATKKQMSHFRVTSDDQRRYREIWQSLNELVTTYHPYAVGVEAYRVFEGRGGNAWKTAVVYGGIIFWAHTRNLYVAPFLPTDLKKRFCDKTSASKQEVEDRLCFLISGLDKALSCVPASKREHVSDAAGHAYLVLEEVARHRKMLGIDS